MSQLSKYFFLFILSYNIIFLENNICIYVILDAQFEDYCIADEQTPDEELQNAINWACGNGADCSKIRLNQPCYLPNTVKDHASFAFNSYYQKFKHKGGSCYFNAAAIITALDPSKKL